MLFLSTHYNILGLYQLDPIAGQVNHESVLLNLQWSYIFVLTFGCEGLNNLLLRKFILFWLNRRTMYVHILQTDYNKNTSSNLYTKPDFFIKILIINQRIVKSLKNEDFLRETRTWAKYLCLFEKTFPDNVDMVAVVLVHCLLPNITPVLFHPSV